MNTKIKIALDVSTGSRPDKVFAFKLKEELYNEPCEFKNVSKIFVISDIEGNFNAFTKILIKNQVIDKYYKWMFDEGHLVILGDCFDRGEQVIECLWLIYSLEEKARRKGGYVHFILGNHEIMNINGDWRYVHPKYANKTNKIKGSIAALYNGNNELWRWLCTKNIIEKIDDILFAHAGISESLISLNLSIHEINNKARPFYTRANHQFIDSQLNLILNSDQSPFWYRGYYQGTATQSQINKTLTNFNVSTIVTGHTVVDTISTYFEGKVINTNTNHASGVSEALLIENNKFYKVNFLGDKYILK